MCNCNQNQNFNYQNFNNSYNNFTPSQAFPNNYLYGHAYTPNQNLNKTFTPEIGLQNGTMFPELVSPYYPGQSIDFINFLRNGGNMNGNM